MSADNYQRSIKTVSQITKEIKSLFEHRYQFVRISGEISNLSRPHSGHHYFNLKDENAQIRAVLFKNQSRYLEKQLSDGQQIICDGRITIYEPRGEYQIIVDSVDFCGSGHLQIAFEQLKSKLLREGLFNQELKKEKDAVAAQLEGMFASVLIKTMRQTLGEEGLFPGDSADILGGLFDQFMSEEISSGGGFGVADTFRSQL